MSKMPNGDEPTKLAALCLDVVWSCDLKSYIRKLNLFFPGNWVDHSFPLFFFWLIGYLLYKIYFENN